MSYLRGGEKSYWRLLITLAISFGSKSSLTWIQTVWHTDGIPEKKSSKMLILKKSADDKKALKIIKLVKS